MDTAFTGLEESSSDKSVKLVVATALQKLWSTGMRTYELRKV
jgi:hypothetical protein